MAVDTTTPRRDMAWTHWVNGIAGILLFIAPWVLGYSGSSTPALASWILGALIAIFAFIGLAPAAGLWTMWVSGILGILAFLAPWVLGYSGSGNPAYACWVLGAIAVIFAAIDVFAPHREGVAV